MAEQGEEQSFCLEVEGQVFDVRPSENGGTHYDWISGPNAGYGFSSSGSGDVEFHEQHIRTFLSMIDPDTGYIED